MEAAKLTESDQTRYIPPDGHLGDAEQGASSLIVQKLWSVTKRTIRSRRSGAEQYVKRSMQDTGSSSRASPDPFILTIPRDHLRLVPLSEQSDRLR